MPVKGSVNPLTYSLFRQVRQTHEKELKHTCYKERRFHLLTSQSVKYMDSRGDTARKEPVSPHG